jgi:hypothetical protein
MSRCEESFLHWETVENILGLRDGIQVHSSFHTDVKELKYQDLLTSTFTLADHERGMQTGGQKMSAAAEKKRLLQMVGG